MTEAVSTKAIAVPRELFNMLLEDAVELHSKDECKKDEERCGYAAHYAERQHRIDRAVRFREASRILLCDNCGAVHPDDDASESESCECTRWLPRMDWARITDG